MIEDPSRTEPAPAEPALAERAFAEPAFAEAFDSAAERAVGRDQPDADFRLSPLSHADALPPEAGALARVLRRPEIRILMEEYERFDRDAIRAQRRFHALRATFRWIAGVTAATGALSLGLQVALDYVSDLQLLLVAIHLIGLIALILFAWRIDRAEPRRRWKAARGEAEWRRISLFTRVTDAEEPHDESRGELPLAPLQLAYFRRYQLATQIRYFEMRPKAIERAVGLAGGLTWLAALAGLAAFVIAALALADILAESGVALPASLIAWVARDIPGVVPWALSVVIVSSAFAVLLMQSETSEAARETARYRSLARNLRHLLKRGYEPVREAVEAGDGAALRRFVDLVHSRLTAEVEEWLSSGLRHVYARTAPGAEPVRDAEEPSASAVSDLSRLLDGVAARASGER